MFAPAPGHTVDQVSADLGEEFSQDPMTVARERNLVRDGRFYGLAAVVKGPPAIVTEQLNAGTYYLSDVNTAMKGGAGNR